MKENIEIFLPITGRQAVHKVETAVGLPFRKPFFGIYKDKVVAPSNLENVKRQSIDEIKLNEPKIYGIECELK